MEKQLRIHVTEASKDYELLDSGEGEKLERFGEYVLARPDPQALWKKNMPEEVWAKADAVFTRSAEKNHWNVKAAVKARWQIELGGLNFFIRPTSFKHTGLFPEQLSNWKWIEEVIGDARRKDPERKISVLNLFGYTGGASLASAKAGASLVHVDGSKTALSWASENAEISGLADKPIRWILDDAHSFVKREIKRKNTYDAIIMDPPTFGHGPKNEQWKIEDSLSKLLDDTQKILSEKPLFFLINGYAAGYSALAYENLLQKIVPKSGKIETGELAIAESNTGRLLPAGIFTRWQSI